MKYYHATTEETMEKIFTDGAIDACIYARRQLMPASF